MIASHIPAAQTRGDEAGGRAIRTDAEAIPRLCEPRRVYRGKRRIRTYQRLRREGMRLEAGLSGRMRKQFPDYANLVAYTD